MASWFQMFRSKQYVLNNPMVFVIEKKLAGKVFLGVIWNTLINRLDHEYVEIVNGPKIYIKNFTEHENKPLHKGFSLFQDYVKSQESDVKIFVTREFFDYV